MGTLTPDQRPDRNGRIVTRWVRKLSGRDRTAQIPMPPATPAQEEYSRIEALSKSIPSKRSEIQKAAKFVAAHDPEQLSPRTASQSENSTLRFQEAEGFLMRMEEKTLRRVSEFIDNPDNGAVARSMCASVIAAMAQKYRYRTDDYSIDYTTLHNITLLGEDFYRSVPEPALDSVRREISFGTIRDMNFRFSTLMDEIKPQNLSKTPAFTTLSEKEQRNARVALVIANTYYTGASTSNRHRESELLECVDRNFEKRFDIAAILDRHMDATPSLIEEILTIETRSFQDGWL